MIWSVIKVCIYSWENSKWNYMWTNLYGLQDFNIWLPALRDLCRCNGESYKEVQNYDGSLTIITKKDEIPQNKYICKISTTNNREEKR